jgi:hypothetical protein
MITCVYYGKRLVQPIVKHHNKAYHLDCYMEKDGCKILTKFVLDNIIRRLVFTGEICDYLLVDKTSSEERQQRHNKYEEIRNKYEDLLTEKLKEDYFPNTIGFLEKLEDLGICPRMINIGSINDFSIASNSDDIKEIACIL